MKSAAIIAATALAVASIHVLPASADQSTVQQSAVKMADKSALEVQQTAADSEIRQVIATAVNDAVTPKHMSKLVDLFANGQAHEIATSNTYSQGYGEKLNDQIGSIAKAWQQKYGDTFTISKATNALTEEFASIQTEGSTKNATMESATVMIRGNKNAGAFDVPMVCEDHEWKINVPSALTAEKLRDNLLAQLTEVDNHSAHWPANESDAYRAVAHHVLAAILNRPMPKNDQAMATPQPAMKVAQQTSAQPRSAAVKPASYHWYEFWNW